MQGDVTGSLEKLSGAWETLKINMFSSQSGMLKDTLDWLTEFVQMMGVDGFWGALLDDFSTNLLIIKTQVLSFLDRAGLEIVHAVTVLGVQMGAALASGFIQAKGLWQSAITTMGDALVAKLIEGKAAMGLITEQEKELQLQELFDINKQTQVAQEKEQQAELAGLVAAKELALQNVTDTRAAQLDAIEAGRDEEINALQQGQAARWAGIFTEAERAKTARDDAAALGQNLGGAASNVKDASEGIQEIAKDVSALPGLSESRFLTGVASRHQETAMQTQAKLLLEAKQQTKWLEWIAKGGTQQIPNFGSF
jgi:hypothetical protein